MKETVLAIVSLFQFPRRLGPLNATNTPISSDGFGTKCIYCQMARDKFTTKQHLSNVPIFWHENNAKLKGNVVQLKENDLGFFLYAIVQSCALVSCKMINTDDCVNEYKFKYMLKCDKGSNFRYDT